MKTQHSPWAACIGVLERARFPQHQGLEGGMIGKEEIVDAFPFLAAMGRSAQARVLSAMLTKLLDDGQILVRKGAECSYLPFVVSGTLRVFELGEQGKELTLYRVERGESCILTATCILNRGEFPAIAQSEGRTAVALLPSAMFAGLVEEHPQWRQYLFGLYSHRLETVLSVVEEIAFHHVDARIIDYLLTSGRAGSVRTTHQQIASEVGTSREVVSRILKDLEMKGVVETSRGMITILDEKALRNRLEN